MAERVSRGSEGAAKKGRQSVYRGDSMKITIKGYMPEAQRVPYGTDVRGVLFDGYPQLVKKEESKPVYRVKKEKDLMVPMRDGVRICTDVYRPDAAGKKFPALLAYGMWGKDLQEAVSWLADKPQPYYDSPFWDGTMEGGNYEYTVPRGYAHVIPDPRGIGNSEGYATPEIWDVYDMVEWIAAQPWCNGKVGMIGPSSYSAYQMLSAPAKPPHLVALRPDECMSGTGDYFTGIFDTLWYHIPAGRHANDSSFVYPNYGYAPRPPKMMAHPDIKKRIEEALEHPDIKHNSKWYAHIKYPNKFPMLFDSLLTSLHPQPCNPYVEWDILRGGPFIADISIPVYAGTPWVNRFYIWATFEAFQHVGAPKKKKKLIVYPPTFPHRPYVQYHDENGRWHDYWLKGIDTGIMDEPPIKLFVMGVNKWRFESEWPLARTKWTKFYLQPGGGLSSSRPSAAEPEVLTQPAPYMDPTVYCLRYATAPLNRDTEVTGPIALYLEASIDIDDTNWMADLVDIDPKGNGQWVSSGHLKAAHRALEEAKSKPYLPIHRIQDPVPVTPGQVVEYAIAMMPTSNVFRKGHRMELVVRNQDDLLSRLGSWGVYMSPFMRTVTHTIHFGKSHLLLPVIPG
jgi:hypothetical protein